MKIKLATITITDKEGNVIIEVSFWGFCARYLNDRYGENYCISAEQSLLLHTGDHTVPRQLIVRSTKGNNLPTNLLFNTSLFVMKSTLPQKAEIEI
ncbi:MAG: hypothetical protein K0B37_15850, partial [Bacteroidales bacterium]|nr:hypothetical protein [Bacteroidales bacterium]